MLLKCAAEVTIWNCLWNFWRF